MSKFNKKLLLWCLMFVLSQLHRQVFSYKNLLQELLRHKVSLCKLVYFLFLLISWLYQKESQPLIDFYLLFCIVQQLKVFYFYLKVNQHFDAIILKFEHIHVFMLIMLQYSNDLKEHNNLQLFCINLTFHNILLHIQPYQPIGIYQQVHSRVDHFLEFIK